MSSPLLARRSALLIGVLALALAGVRAYQLMPRSLEPAVSTPYGVVEARLPGVSALELETVLARPIEDALLALPEVLSCRTETRDGLVLVLAECGGESVESGSAWTAIEDRMARLRDELVDGFIGLSGPSLNRSENGLVEAMITVRADDGLPLEQAQELADLLQRSAAVDHVELVGRPLEQIVLSYEDRELADAKLTPLEFRAILRAQHVTAPGAYLSGDGSIAPIETVARIKDYEQLRQLPIRDPADGDPVNLSRLLDVSREPVSPAVERVFASGTAALVLAVYRTAGARLEEFAASVRSVVEGPSAAGCELVVFQPDVVAEEVDRFRGNLLQGFGLILILLLLVLGLRPGIAVATVVPFVLLTSCAVLLAAGFGLDVVTLSSFILVLGLLVDNHIVMAERIQRLKEQGEGHGVAISRAARELIGPLLAASATTTFGFLPVILTDDSIGEYVGSLFWVVLVTLSVSLLFCFTVTPLLLSRSPARQHRSLLEGVYRACLRIAFPLAVPLLLISGGLCFAGFQLLKNSDQIFFPASSRPLWMLEIESPHGTDAGRTEALSRQLDALLATETSGPLSDWVTFIGRSAPAFQPSIPYREFAPHYAQVLLRLDPEGDPAALEERLRAWMKQQDQRTRLRLRPVRLGAQLEWPIQVRVSGPEQELHAAAERVSENLATRECVNISTDWSEPIRKLRVVPDRAALASRDLTVADLTAGMHSVLHGLPLFHLDEAGRRTPVMLRARVKRDNTEEALADAYVHPQKGDPALLYEVAEVIEVREHPLRARQDGVPCITVRAETVDPDRALVREIEIDEWLETERAAHPRLRYEVTGLSAAAGDANQAILEQMPWALLLVLLCLLIQSRSLIDTLLILLTIPLSFTGVAFGLQLTGQPFSFMTLVGMTALAGIVVNNAIVLLTSIRRRVEEDGGYSRDALIECAVHRLRPILLTALCALASMAVLYHSGGPMWRPLATAVISGLVLSTALVLFVLPVVYGLALRLSIGRAAAPPE